MKEGYVYIMASKKNGVLYVGVTSNLKERIWQHREWVIDWFTKKYFVKKLVYYEIFWSIIESINREKQLKWIVRAKKIELIVINNSHRNDLYDEI